MGEIGSLERRILLGVGVVSFLLSLTVSKSEFLRCFFFSAYGRTLITTMLLSVSASRAW